MTFLRINTYLQLTGCRTDPFISTFSYARNLSAIERCYQYYRRTLVMQRITSITHAPHLSLIYGVLAAMFAATLWQPVVRDDKPGETVAQRYVRHM